MHGGPDPRAHAPKALPLPASVYQRDQKWPSRADSRYRSARPLVTFCMQHRAVAWHPIDRNQLPIRPSLSYEPKSPTYEHPVRGRALSSTIDLLFGVVHFL